MRVLSAYLLAVLGGKANPAAGDITKILDSVGLDADADLMKKLLADVEGKDLDEVIKEGLERLASVPSGGAVAAGGGGAAAGGGGAAAEEKKEEAPAEEEEDEDMGFSLFD